MFRFDVSNICIIVIQFTIQVKIFLQSYCNTTGCITFMSMKRTIITVEVDKELKQHLEGKAVKKDVTLSRYIRAALVKVSKYKEKLLV